jgi:SAM-dependent methyltransferase
VLADASLRCWPFADESFDSIICRHVIEHISDLIAFFEEVHRIGKPGAAIAIVTPHFSNRYSYADPTHLHHLSWRSFDFFAEDLGTYAPNLWERALELKHPARHFYTRARFRIRRRRLSFGRPFRLSGLQRLANQWPDLYELYFAFIVPARDLYVELEVVK